MTAAQGAQLLDESNPQKNRRVREWLISNVSTSQMVCFKCDASFYSTELPDSRPLSGDRGRSLVDNDMKEELERAGLINWCPNVRRLLPIRVPADGNCLLHSAAVAVWGVTDNQLFLRRLLHVALRGDNQGRLYQRWRHHRYLQISRYLDRMQESNLLGLEEEWRDVTGCLDAHHKSSSRAVPHRFLESIHVYALANVLRRPVLVLTDPVTRSFTGLSLQDNSMGGVYLPLEWSPAQTCCTPVLIGYSQSHFAPLLPVRLSGNSDLTPLINSRYEQLPVRFLLKEEEAEVGGLLGRYLKVKETVMGVGGDIHSVLCARLDPRPLPANLNLTQDFNLGQSREVQGSVGSSPRLLYAPTREQQIPLGVGQFPAASKPTGPQRANQIHIPSPRQEVGLNDLSAGKKCVVPACRFYGDPELSMMCSSCFKDYTIQESRLMVAASELHGGAAEPSAPLQSLTHQQSGQLSMMTERCREGCGYRCSVNTYPYCHECADRRQKLALEKERVDRERAWQENVKERKGAVPLAHQSQVAVGKLVDTELNVSGGPLVPLTGQVPASAQLVDVKSPLPGPPASRPLDPTQPLTPGEPWTPLTPPDPAQDLMMFSGLDTAAIKRETEQATIKATQDESVNPVPAANTQEGVGSSALHQGDNQWQPLYTEPHFSQAAISPAAETGAQPLAAASREMPAPSTGQMNENCSQASKPQLQGKCSQGCGEEIQVHDLCGKCYVSQGVQATQSASPYQQVPQPTWPYQQVPQPTSPYQQVPQPTSPYQQTLQPTSPYPHSPRPQSPYQQTPKPSLPYQQAPARYPNVQQLRSLVSASNSAPASIGLTSNPSQGKNSPSSQRRSSLSHLPSQVNKVSSWLEANSVPSGQVALAERPQGEPLDSHDLLVSGSQCYSSTPRCIGEGCGQPVAREKQLCDHCQNILRQAHHSLQGEGQQCLAEGCSYTGSADTAGYCSRCYQRLFSRELEQELRRPLSELVIGPASQSNISVPPDFRCPSPVPARGSLCRAGDCSMYGDPQQGGMCSRHYQQAAAGVSQPSEHSQPINLVIGGASSVHIGPVSSSRSPSLNSSGQGQVSVPPPSFQGSVVCQPSDLGLEETYKRIAGQPSSQCRTPGCGNFGNPGKRGWCNSCALTQMTDERLIQRYVIGEEETG